VRGETEAWQHAMDSLGIFFDHSLASGRQQPAGPRRHTIELAAEQAPEDAQQFIGSYLEIARLLGKRIAEVHVKLASRPEDPAFAPEPFTDFYRHGLYHGLLSQIGRGFELLRGSLPVGGGEALSECERLVAREPEANKMLRKIRDQRFEALRIRIHGGLNLHRALFTGKDFILIDFEGDSDRPISERRIKRSPLLDVASMLRSLHYASHVVLLGPVSGVVAPRTDGAPLERWANFWYDWVSAAFLAGYLATPGVSALLPSSRPQLRLLLNVFLLDQGMRELRYELSERPDWLRLPVRGILELLDTE